MLRQAGEGGALSEVAEVDVLAVLRRALGPRGRAVAAVEERALSGALPLKDVSRCRAPPPPPPFSTSAFPSLLFGLHDH